MPSASASCLPRASLGGPQCHEQDAKMSMEALGGCVRVFWAVQALGEAGAAAGARLQQHQSSSELCTLLLSCPPPGLLPWGRVGLWNMGEPEQAGLTPWCCHLPLSACTSPSLGDTQCLLSPNPGWCSITESSHCCSVELAETAAPEEKPTLAQPHSLGMMDDYGPSALPGGYGFMGSTDSVQSVHYYNSLASPSCGDQPLYCCCGEVWVKGWQEEK